MRRHWTDQDETELQAAADFHDLLAVAESVAARIPEPTVQVCGPISTGGAGSIAANLQRFQHAIDVLDEAGWEVFDQMPFEDKILEFKQKHEGDGYVMDILEIFYHGIFTSGHIHRAVFLPDWESSTGATWERETLADLPIEITEYPDKLFVEVQKREG